MGKAGGMTAEDVVKQALREQGMGAGPQGLPSDMVQPGPVPTSWQVGAGEGMKAGDDGVPERFPVVVIQTQRPSGQDVFILEIDGKYGVERLIEELQKYKASAKSGLLLPGTDGGQAPGH